MFDVSLSCRLISGPHHDPHPSPLSGQREAVESGARVPSVPLAPTGGEGEGEGAGARPFDKLRTGVRLYGCGGPRKRPHSHAY